MSLSEQAKEARREYKRKWYQKNREHVLNYHKEWREENPERIKKYQKDYWENKAMKEA